MLVEPYQALVATLQAAGQPVPASVTLAVRDLQDAATEAAAAAAAAAAVATARLQAVGAAGRSLRLVVKSGPASAPASAAAPASTELPHSEVDDVVDVDSDDGGPPAKRVALG